MGHGGFTAVDRGWAALIALAIAGLLFAWLATLRQSTMAGDKSWLNWFAGLFIGTDGEPSLSLFQVFIWTVITVWGFIYVFSVTGSLLNMTVR